MRAPNAQHPSGRIRQAMVGGIPDSLVGRQQIAQSFRFSPLLLQASILLNEVARSGGLSFGERAALYKR